MENKKWTPSQDESLGVITSVYEVIKEELSELQKETGCPDSFIYDFIGKIQNEWHPESCHSIVRNKKKLENIKSSTHIYKTSLIKFELKN